MQSSGNQSLTDQNDAAAASRPGVRHRPAAQPRRLGLPARQVGEVDSATGTPAYSDQQFVYDRHQDQFEQVMGYFWVNQAAGVPPVARLRLDAAPPILEAAVRGQDQPVRRRQQLPDRQAVPDPARQGRGGRRRGRRGDRARVRPRGARRPGAGFGASLDAGSIGEAFGDYLAVSVGLAAAAAVRLAGRPRRPARWTGTRPPTRRARTASAASTPASRSPQRSARCTSTARSGARRSGRSGRATSSWDGTTEDWDTTLIASQFDYAPGHQLPVGGEGDLPGCPRADGVAAANLVRHASEPAASPSEGSGEG